MKYQTIGDIPTFGGHIKSGTIVVVTPETETTVKIEVPGGLTVHGLDKSRVRIADCELVF